MKNFLLISHSLDTLPLLVAISNQPRLWDTDTIRTQHHGTVHSAVHDILLHFQQPGAVDVSTDASHDCFVRPAWWALPEARPLVFGLMARVQATRLGRCMITKLPPGEQIPAHTDSPHQTQYWRRHQITLCSPQECQFIIEDEVMALAPGTCWWINNGAEHQVINDGPTERIALIVDVHCPPMEPQYGTNSPRQPEPARRQRRGLV